MMYEDRVFVGMGGNIGDTVEVLNQALTAIRQLNGVEQLQCSNYYRTSPVSTISQGEYINAVCTFRTKMRPKLLLKHLQQIECLLGKVPKPKDFPRIVDLDLLLYGKYIVKEKNLQIPHPYWKERLFVLVPMKDLVDTLVIPDQNSPGAGITVDLSEMIARFKNVNHEKIQLLNDGKK